MQTGGAALPGRALWVHAARATGIRRARPRSRPAVKRQQTDDRAPAPPCWPCSPSPAWRWPRVRRRMRARTLTPRGSRRPPPHPNRSRRRSHKLRPETPTTGAQAPPAPSGPSGSSGSQPPSTTPNKGTGDPNVVATKLAAPTGLTLLPDGTALVGERTTGRIVDVQPTAGKPVKVIRTLAGLELRRRRRPARSRAVPELRAERADPGAGHDRAGHPRPRIHRQRVRSPPCSA